MFLYISSGLCYYYVKKHTIHRGVVEKINKSDLRLQFNDFNNQINRLKDNWHLSLYGTAFPKHF